MNVATTSDVPAASIGTGNCACTAGRGPRSGPTSSGRTNSGPTAGFRSSSGGPPKVPLHRRRQRSRRTRLRPRCPTQVGPEGIRFDFNFGCRAVLPVAEHPWRCG